MIHRAIVLLSGGMDSLVTVAIAKNENDEVFFLHANYGQRTEKKEKECFQNLVAFYHPKDILEADIGFLAQIGGTSLIDKSMDIPVEKSNSIPSTYVPFRNAHLICIAVSWAEVIHADRIYIGAVEEDSSGYPDCREAFYNSMTQTIALGTKDDTHIEIITPVIHKTKAEIVRIGQSLNAPFEISWSCYQNNDKACGVCDSCKLRLKAFHEAGLVDPIPYL